MHLELPPLPDSLRSTRWRIVPPHLPEFLDPIPAVLREWTAQEPTSMVTSDGWTTWWATADNVLWMIYELHVFVAIVQVTGVAAANVADVIAAGCAARVDLDADEPIALADLVGVPGHGLRGPHP